MKALSLHGESGLKAGIREARQINIALMLVQLYTGRNYTGDAIRLRDLRGLILEWLNVTPTKPTSGDLKAHGDALGMGGLNLDTFRMNGDRWVYLQRNMHKIGEFMVRQYQNHPENFNNALCRIVTEEIFDTPPAPGEVFVVKIGRKRFDVTFSKPQAKSGKGKTNGVKVAMTATFGSTSVSILNPHLIGYVSMTVDFDVVHATHPSTDEAITDHLHERTVVAHALSKFFLTRISRNEQA